jgi:hypothetical protein
MMKKSPIFNFKPWSKIHPPLPRNPRESQQLLDALTSSFRRQLDASDSNQPAKSTDLHVQSILNHPLFRVTPSKPVREFKQHIFPQQRLLTDPMAVMDELMAAGTLTGNDIHACLSSLMVIAGSTTGDTRRVLKKYGAGGRVVSWFWSADSESKKSLFKSRKGTRATLKFVAAEGLQDMALLWLRMLVRCDLGGIDGKIPPKAARGLFRNFLVDFLTEEIRYGNGLESALQYFLQASQMLNDNHQAQLTVAATSIIEWIIDHHSEKSVKSLSPKLYDEFIGMIADFKYLRLLTGALKLYHPTNPDPNLLLVRTREDTTKASNVLSNTERDRMSRVYVDAFRLFLEQDRDEDASWMASLAKQLLSNASIEQKKLATNTFSSQDVHQHDAGFTGLLI